jgi:hypothetical protein
MFLSQNNVYQYCNEASCHVLFMFLSWNSLYQYILNLPVTCKTFMPKHVMCYQTLPFEMLQSNWTLPFKFQAQSISSTSNGRACVNHSFLHSYILSFFIDTIIIFTYVESNFCITSKHFVMYTYYYCFLNSKNLHQNLWKFPCYITSHFCIVPKHFVYITHVFFTLEEFVPVYSGIFINNLWTFPCYVASHFCIVPKHFVYITYVSQVISAMCRSILFILRMFRKSFLHCAKSFCLYYTCFSKLEEFVPVYSGIFHK